MTDDEVPERVLSQGTSTIFPRTWPASSISTAARPCARGKRLVTGGVSVEATVSRVPGEARRYSPNLRPGRRRCAAPSSRKSPDRATSPRATTHGTGTALPARASSMCISLLMSCAVPPAPGAAAPAAPTRRQPHQRRSRWRSTGLSRRVIVIFPWLGTPAPVSHLAIAAGSRHAPPSAREVTPAVTSGCSWRAPRVPCR